jgi:hypothetical protein
VETVVFLTEIPPSSFLKKVLDIPLRREEDACDKPSQKSKFRFWL